MSSNNNKQTVPTEDGPVMRSVMLDSRPSIGIPAPSRIGIPKPRSFGVVSKASTSKTVRISNTSTWKVSSELPAVPTMYPLERSHVSIEDDAQSVANRITECLRTQSIMATYDETSAMAETSGYCRFAIHLFKNGNSVVVEIQRRCGCSYEFHYAAKLILSAVKQEAAPVKKTLKVPASIVSLSKQEEVHQEALEIAQDLISKDRLDAQLLGMESLVQLSKSCPEFIAKILMKQCPVQKALLNLVVEKRLSNDGSDLTEMEQDYSQKMHRCALTVLANGWTAMEAKAPKVQESVLNSLVQQLGMAPESPHEACQASKCLLAVHANFELAELQDAMDVAMHEGNCRHQELQQVTSKLYAASGRI